MKKSEKTGLAWEKAGFRKRMSLFAMAIFCTGGFLLSAQMASAATRTWTGNSSTSWNDSGNWGGTIPTSSDTAVIPTGRSNYPTVSSGSVTTDASTVTIQSGGSITVSGGTFTANGNFTIDQGGTLTLSGGTTTVSTAQKTFTQNGTLNISSATLNVWDFTGSGTTTMSGNVALLRVDRDFYPTTPANFHANSGTVEFTGSSAHSSNAFPAGTYTFYNLTIDSAHPGLGEHSTTVDINNNLSIASSGQADFSGSDNTAKHLYLNSNLQATGTWGSTSSSATHQNDSFFTGTGIITVEGTEITTFDAISNVNGGTAGLATYKDAADVIEALPKTVTANSGGVTVPVSTWVDTDSYNAEIGGSYTFTATLGTLPADWANSGHYTATVEVVLSSKTEITGFDSIANVSAGTARIAKYDNADEVKAVLPTSVTANSGVVTVPVSKWVDTDSYNADEDGSYTFTATLGPLPAGWSNSSNYTAHVEVVIGSDDDSAYIPNVIDKSRILEMHENLVTVVKTNFFRFQGQVSSLNKKDLVEIYRGNAKIGTAKIKANKKWRLKTVQKDDGVSQTYYFRYLRSSGEVVKTTPNYQVLVDKKDPWFVGFSNEASVNPGDTITWTVADNDQIKYLKVKFQKKTYNLDSPSFQIPTDAKKGVSKLIVTIYDRAENGTSRKMMVKVN